jgi:hypothetical protein
VTYLLLSQARLNELDQAIRQSRVRINFETTEPLLINLKADNDKISVKLNSTLQVRNRIHSVLAPSGDTVSVRTGSDWPWIFVTGIHLDLESFDSFCNF